MARKKKAENNSNENDSKNEVKKSDEFGATLNTRKTKAKQTAKQLFYGNEIIKKIESATSIVQIENILIDARHAI